MGRPLILPGRHFRLILLYLCVCIYFSQHCSLFDMHVALELVVMEHSLPPLLLCRCGSACHPGPYSGAKAGQKVKSGKPQMASATAPAKKQLRPAMFPEHQFLSDTCGCKKRVLTCFNSILQTCENMKAPL